MRRETSREREAWTAHVERRELTPASKYGNERGKFASKYEASVASKLSALETCGIISELCYQVPLVLVAGNGKIRPIKYIADFTYLDKEGRKHWVDAKGCKTPMYRLKRKLAALLHGIEIEEV